MERTETLTAAAAPAQPVAGSYADWAAVLAGAAVAAAIAGLFMTFGAALGLSTISADPGEGSFNAWVIVTGLWLVVTLVASYLAGGYVAGRMRRRVDGAAAEEVAARDGINGLVVWALGMLVTAWMAAGALGTAATTAGNVAGAATQAAGAALGGAAQGLGNAMAGDGTDTAAGWIADTLRRPVLGTPPAGVPEAAPAADTAELARQSAAILANTARTGEIADTDRAWLAAATARLTGLPPAEAEARVEQAVASAQEFRAGAQRMADEAEAAARDAAETARIGAILSAFILTAAALVAGAAAMAGAVRGGRHRDEGRLFGGFSYRI